MQEQEEQNKPQPEFIQRKSLCQLIYKKLEDAAAITTDQYEQALGKYPLLSQLLPRRLNIAPDCAEQIFLCKAED